MRWMGRQRHFLPLSTQAKVPGYSCLPLGSQPGPPATALGPTALSVEAELVPGPSLNLCLYSFEHLRCELLVLFPKALVFVENYFPLQPQLGCAKSISSVSFSFLHHHGSKTRNESELWEMQRVKASPSLCPQTLTLPKCLKREGQMP